MIQARFRAGDGLIDPRAITMGLLEGSGAEVVTGLPGDRLSSASGRVRRS